MVLPPLTFIIDSLYNRPHYECERKENHSSCFGSTKELLERKKVYLKSFLILYIHKGEREKKKFI